MGELISLIQTGGDLASIGVLAYLVILDRRVLRLEIHHGIQTARKR